MGATTTPRISTLTSHSKDCHATETSHHPTRHGQADTERAYGFADAPAERYRMQSSRQGRAAVDTMLGGPAEARSWSPCADFSSPPQAFTSPLAASKSQQGLWLGPSHPVRTIFNHQTQVLLGSRLWEAKPHPWWGGHMVGVPDQLRADRISCMQGAPAGRKGIKGLPAQQGPSRARCPWPSPPGSS